MTNITTDQLKDPTTYLKNLKEKPLDVSGLSEKEAKATELTRAKLIEILEDENKTKSFSVELGKLFNFYETMKDVVFEKAHDLASTIQLDFDGKPKARYKQSNNVYEQALDPTKNMKRVANVNKAKTSYDLEAMRKRLGADPAFKELFEIKKNNMEESGKQVDEKQAYKQAMFHYTIGYNMDEVAEHASSVMNYDTHTFLNAKDFTMVTDKRDDKSEVFIKKQASEFEQAQAYRNSAMALAKLASEQGLASVELNGFSSRTGRGKRIDDTFKEILMQEFAKQGIYISNLDPDNSVKMKQMLKDNATAKLEEEKNTPTYAVTMTTTELTNDQKIKLKEAAELLKAQAEEELKQDRIAAKAALEAITEHRKETGEMPAVVEEPANVKKNEVEIEEPKPAPKSGFGKMARI